MTLAAIARECRTVPPSKARVAVRNCTGEINVGVRFNENRRRNDKRCQKEVARCRVATDVKESVC
jgi:hypothetical protein